MKNSLKWIQVVSLIAGFGCLTSLAGSAQVQDPRLMSLKAAADRVNSVYTKAPPHIKQGFSNNALNLVNLSRRWNQIEPLLRKAASQPRQAAPLAIAPSSLTKQVSNPAYDYTLSQTVGFTQSETSTAQCGSQVLSAYNDSGSYVETLAVLPRTGLSFIGYAQSYDGGKTFIDKTFLTPGTSTSNFLGGDPVVGCSNANTFYIASLFQGSTGYGISVSKSTNGGFNFGNPVVAASRGFSNFLDKEWMAVDPTNPNRLYVTYTNFGTRTSIELVRSIDGGLTWSTPVVIAESPSYSSYVQGSQVIVGPEGNVYVAWQDVPSSGPSRLLIRKSINNGGTFDPAVTITNVTRIGSIGRLKGNFRVNEFPSLAVNRTTGALYVTWNDGRTNNTPDIYSGTYYYSDVFFSSSTNQGSNWSTPVRVNNNSEPTGSTSLGSDQFFPAIAVDKTGKLAVCFYDRRNDATNLLIDRYCATSTNNGSSWINTRYTRQPFRPIVGVDRLINTVYMGDYDTLATDFTTNLSGFVGAYADHSLPQAPDVRATKFN